MCVTRNQIKIANKNFDISAASFFNPLVIGDASAAYEKAILVLPSTKQNQKSNIRIVELCGMKNRRVPPFTHRIAFYVLSGTK